jgi:copper chaperone CopZ
MKYLLSSFAVLLLTIAPIHAQERTDDIVVEVSGLVCDFCAQSLEKVFGKEDSVHGIQVDLDKQTVTVDLKDGESLSDEKIKEIIEWGGYDLVEIKRN